MPKKLSDATPAMKLMGLFFLLNQRGNRGGTLTELAELLECSKPTILRLVDQMQSSKEFGHLVAEKVGRQMRYWLRTPPQMRMSISPEGLRQMALCRNLLRQTLPESIKRTLDSTLQEAGAHTREDTPQEAVTIGQSYVKGRIDNTSHQEKLAVFMKALETRRICVVTYRKSVSALPRDIHFAPKRLVVYHETFQLVGWEVSEKGRRRTDHTTPMHLLLHRCVNVRMTHRGSDHLPDAPAAQPEEGIEYFGIMRTDEPFQVKVLFSPKSATYVHEREWSGHDVKTLRDDGSLVLEFAAQSRSEVVSMLLGFGAEARVISPDWLREEMARQGELIASANRATPPE
jgi:predicted DNA-binding transcriptional regulator YafY